MTFISDEYKVPESAGKYFKFRVGANRFRALAPAITGFEGWKKIDGKDTPVRHRDNEPFPMEEVDDPDKIKPFWAFPVWNPEIKRVQLLKITQKGIMRDMLALARNKKWGDPMEYDIIVSAVGENMEREYSTQPDPKEPLSEEAQAAWDKVKEKFNLDVYFANGDVFGDE